jgi:hypothetical protein
MEEFGPVCIAESYEWHDHDYKICENKILIEVYKVTTDHNDKK